MAAHLPAPLQDTPQTWMSALTRVMARVTAAAGRERVMDALVAGLVDEFGIVLARVWLYDPADDSLQLRASAGPAAEYRGAVTRVPMRDVYAPVARAVEQREVVVLNAIDAGSGFRDVGWIRRAGLRAYAGFPLLIGDRAIGAMVVFQRQAWPPPMVEALSALAQQAALALEHARLFEESQTLQAIAAELASARHTDTLLEGIVERTVGALAADACAVWLFDERGRLTLTAARGFSEAYHRRLATLRPRRSAVAVDEAALAGRPSFVPDLRALMAGRDPELAEETAVEGIVSSLRLPLLAPGGQQAGWLALYHRRERLYSDDEVRLAQAFTHQIAVALHNARLAEQERTASEAAARRLERLTALAGITARLIAATDQDTVLRVVVESASRLCDASGALVWLIDADRRQMIAAAAHGSARALFDAAGVQPVELTEEYLAVSATGQAISGGSATVVDDYATWPATPPRDRILATGVRSFVAAPLRVGGTAMGLLHVLDTRPRTFAPEDVALVTALADQAALAIEHARLVRRGQDAAVLEERARLARDLHDSVTQSVFSLGMLTRAAQTQHERGAPALGRTLERISTLAQEALAEMRALLFELRPSALTEDGLAAALDKLIESWRGRSDVPISYTATGTIAVRPSAEVEMAVFRIAQEALGNAIKHARASAIAVVLEATASRIAVTVEDDGDGFDASTPAAATPDGRSGGMGMRTMRERAGAAGLTLRIASAPGAGARITVEAPLPRE